MKIFIDYAELIGDAESEAKYIKYNGKKYTLKSEQWEEAEEEAKKLLKELYPNKKIYIQ